jgi:hypothetical protein
LRHYPDDENYWRHFIELRSGLATCNTTAMLPHEPTDFSLLVPDHHDRPARCGNTIEFAGKD